MLKKCICTECGKEFSMGNYLLQILDTGEAKCDKCGGKVELSEDTSSST